MSTGTNGSTAVVTGAAGGLGQAWCRALAAKGYDVVGVDVQGTDRTLDVRDPQACRDLARETRPRVWVNNAGVLGAGDAATQPDDEVRRVVEVNLLGVINGTRAAVEVMRTDGPTGRGHVVNVGSLASWVPVPGECVYAATKAGMLAWTLGLQAELRGHGVTGVRLSVLCPDGMLTPMIEPLLDDPAVAMTFSGLQLVTPEQVAAAGVALLDRPQLYRAVPRWRGGQVRLIAAVPGPALRLAGFFHRVGARNQARVREAVRVSEQVHGPGSPR
ncbi:MAG: SDR family oxidoreductase [Actinomycetia bacterium]|nr:SDR family oxidoreductase [Actinomycetes bacterium]